ncbi:MAG: glycosyl transferase group 1 [Bacteroidetes bacterium]|jgi:glycosyltransferase involved in cell wall biosynthesis|nr:glycosyl transferase group 1 [Bacteroidota bacterium]MDF2452274.1 glycosyl transferase group 1 [Bacteroidota bacterium]
MTSNKTFLFVSIDGMTDPLGQSQVLPYLVGLTKNGYKISIVSCEKKENWKLYHTVIESIVKEAGITWDYCFYKTGKPFISQIQNYFELKKLAIAKLKEEPLKTILHCRSYLSGLIGLYSKRKFNTGFIFDMRGFWADERIEGGIWKKSNPVGGYLYSYFKKREKEMLKEADAIVSLTHKAKSIILDWNFGIKEEKINVIPCCVDLIHFSRKKIEPKKLSDLKAKYPQLDGKFVLSYVGSLGTWYMADEMLEFFKVLSLKKDAIFLIITKDDIQLVHSAAKKHGVSPEKLIVVSSSRSDMPYYITLSTASVFFIKPTFSKSASSPTKMGELLSMGIPVLTNSGIGDVDQIVTENQCGLLVHGFNQNDYRKIADDLIENSNLYKENTERTANQFFSLNEGIDRYTKIYNTFN